MIEPCDHRPHHAGDIADITGRSLTFDYDLPAGHVDGEIEAVRAGNQFDVEQPLHRIRSAQHRGAIAHIVNDRRRQEVGERLADDLLGIEWQIFGQIGRTARNDPVGGQRDQKADRLNRAEDMDGLAITIGEIDGVRIIQRRASFHAHVRFDRTGRTRRTQRLLPFHAGRG